MKLIRPLFIFALLTALTASAVFAQSVGRVEGTVTDANGAVVPGATVSVWRPDGTRVKEFLTNAKGEYTITGLPAGKYVLKAAAKGFDLFEKQDLEIAANQKTEEIIVLMAAAIQENVDVSIANQISTDPDANKDATVLNEKDIEALPDDPDELAAALQALVGPSAGPEGGQIYIDGFMGGQLPPKEAIREIRINSNPFSAEFDRPGNGRIEILTRPGAERFRGSVNAAFNDEALNSRNPFAVNRAPSQLRRFGGSYSGPIKKGRSSFFVDVHHSSQDENTIINAQILNSAFALDTFRQDVTVPSRTFRISPRIDYAINDKNTLVARYSFNTRRGENQGLGETTLLSRAIETNNRGHEIRLTETMIINAKTVNETRFEYNNSRNERIGDNSIPGINVSAAFSGGGASVGNSFSANQNWELHNFTSTSFGKNMQHAVKFGGKLRRESLTDRAENGYAGSFTFAGFFLGAGQTSPCDLNSDQIVSSIEQYRCKLLGNTDPRINPTSFSITTGNPELGISQTEWALFVTDDWRPRPDLLLSFGVRYENQTNLESNFNFAPRLSFAWSPGAGGPKGPMFVVRAGMGVFYERFGENQTLNALRNNGVNQISLFVNANDPDLARRAIAQNILSQPVFTLNGVTNVPTGAQVLGLLPSANTTRQIADTLQAPYNVQTNFSIEKSFLQNKLSGSLFFMMNRQLHLIGERNINAPVCPGNPNLAAGCVGAVRPQPQFGNIMLIESNRVAEMKRFGINLRSNFAKFSMGGGYSYGVMKDNRGNPMYAYDLSPEFANSGAPRHSINLFSNYTLPWGLNLNALINWNSSTRFNLTRGVDVNADGSFSERPTFGELGARCAELGITESFCDVSGFDPTAIIPRNFGRGPAFFTVGRVSLSKTFSFGKSPEAVAAANAGGNRGGGGGGNANRGGGGAPGGGGGGGGRQMVMAGGGGGGPMMMGGPGGFGGGRKPYNLNLSLNVSNLLNTVNYNAPTGVLTSSRFGQYTSVRSGGFGGFGGFGGGGGANRRVELNARFSW